LSAKLDDVPLKSARTLRSFPRKRESSNWAPAFAGANG